jgi:hypothetical protein
MNCSYQVYLNWDTDHKWKGSNIWEGVTAVPKQWCFPFSKDDRSPNVAVRICYASLNNVHTSYVVLWNLHNILDSWYYSNSYYFAKVAQLLDEKTLEKGFTRRSTTNLSVFFGIFAIIFWWRKQTKFSRVLYGTNPLGVDIRMANWPNSLFF